MAWTEYRYQSQNPNQFESAGTIRLHTDGANVKKAAWVVILKLLATIGMITIGFLLVVPSIPLPPLQSFTVAAGTLLIYTGFAYFVRPEPNTDNLGGVFVRDDRTQYNDDINRHLVGLHRFLGPGRFVSETFIDAATLVGLMPERTEEAIEQAQVDRAETEANARRQQIEGRVQTRQAAQEHQGQVELASTKYLAGSSSEAD